MSSSGGIAASNFDGLYCDGGPGAATCSTQAFVATGDTYPGLYDLADAGVYSCAASINGVGCYGVGAFFSWYPPAQGYFTKMYIHGEADYGEYMFGNTEPNGTAVGFNGEWWAGGPGGAQAGISWQTPILAPNFYVSTWSGIGSQGNLGATSDGFVKYVGEDATIRWWAGTLSDTQYAIGLGDAGIEGGPSAWAFYLNSNAAGTLPTFGQFFEPIDFGPVSGGAVTRINGTTITNDGGPETVQLAVGTHMRVQDTNGYGSCIDLDGGAVCGPGGSGACYQSGADVICGGLTVGDGGLESIGPLYVYSGVGWFYGGAEILNDPLVMNGEQIVWLNDGGIQQGTYAGQVEVVGTGNGNDGLQLGPYITSGLPTAGIGAVYNSGVTPGTTNYVIAASLVNSYLNAPSGVVYLQIGGSTVGQITASGFEAPAGGGIGFCTDIGCSGEIYEYGSAQIYQPPSGEPAEFTGGTDVLLNAMPLCFDTSCNVEASESSGNFVENIATNKYYSREINGVEQERISASFVKTVPVIDAFGGITIGNTGTANPTNIATHYYADVLWNVSGLGNVGGIQLDLLGDGGVMGCAVGVAPITPCICQNASPYPNYTCPDGGTTGSIQGMPAYGCVCSCNPVTLSNDAGTTYNAGTVTVQATTTEENGGSAGTPTASHLGIFALNYSGNSYTGNVTLQTACSCDCH